MVGMVETVVGVIMGIVHKKKKKPLEVNTLMEEAAAIQDSEDTPFLPALRKLVENHLCLLKCSEATNCCRP